MCSQKMYMFASMDYVEYFQDSRGRVVSRHWSWAQDVVAFSTRPPRDVHVSIYSKVGEHFIARTIGA